MRISNNSKIAKSPSGAKPSQPHFLNIERLSSKTRPTASRPQTAKIGSGSAAKMRYLSNAESRSSFGWGAHSKPTIAAEPPVPMLAQN